MCAIMNAIIPNKKKVLPLFSKRISPIHAHINAKKINVLEAV